MCEMMANKSGFHILNMDHLSIKSSSRCFIGFGRCILLDLFLLFVVAVFVCFLFCLLGLDCCFVYFGLFFNFVL